MVCAPVRSIIPSLKLEDYISVQAHKLCSISQLTQYNKGRAEPVVKIEIMASMNDRSEKPKSS